MNVSVGDIVQVDPAAANWGGCLVIVTEVKSCGIQGFTPMPPDGGRAYIRIKNEDFEAVAAKAVWTDA